MFLVPAYIPEVTLGSRGHYTQVLCLSNACPTESTKEGTYLYYLLHICWIFQDVDIRPVKQDSNKCEDGSK